MSPNDNCCLLTSAFNNDTLFFQIDIKILDICDIIRLVNHYAKLFGMPCESLLTGYLFQNIGDIVDAGLTSHVNCELGLWAGGCIRISFI